ncbi:MAG TPA: hypothetical protein VNS11_02865 [Sphingomicrobium sp.]|nr:hypothetical protein [Sphingomicrobium sp.]
MSGGTDDMLSAYLDGSLDEAGCEKVRALIAGDPAVAEEFERLRSNDGLLRAALTEGIADPADEDALSRFGLRREPQAKVAALSARRAANDNLRRWVWPAAAAIAASAAVLMIARPAAQPEPWQTGAFSEALESTPSLHEASLPGGASVSPVLSFIAGDGRFCREFHLAGGRGAAGREGLACRRQDGEWQVIAFAPSAGALASGNRIEVAEGPSVAGLDAVYQRLRASDPLPAGEERSLIAKHWSK